MITQTSQSGTTETERDMDILVVKPQPAPDAFSSGNVPGDSGSLIVMEKDRAVEYVPLWQSGQIHRHDLMVGLVTRRMPQLNGVFVAVGTPHDGLLRMKTGESLPSEGSRVIVSVIREAQSGKGPVLSLNLSLPSRYSVFRPGQSSLRRSILASMDKTEADRLFHKDLAVLEAVFANLASAAQSGPAPRCLLPSGDPLLGLLNAWPLRIRSIQVEGTERYLRVERLLAESAPDLLEKLALHPEHRTFDLAAVHRQSGLDQAVRQRQLRLDCGGTLVFDRTEALHVIDVNSGAASGRNKIELAERVNQEAIREIARQVRLRGLTGMIVIDLIHQRDKSVQDRYTDLLRQALSGDRGKSTVYGFSALSLLEMIRTAP